MTTEPLQPHQPQQPRQEGVPQYFLDFVQENARQHAALAESIARSEATQARSSADLQASIARSEATQARSDAGLRESIAEVKGAVAAIRNFTIATFGAMFTLMLIALTAALRGDLA